MYFVHQLSGAFANKLKNQFFMYQMFTTTKKSKKKKQETIETSSTQKSYVYSRENF